MLYFLPCIPVNQRNELDRAIRSEKSDGGSLSIGVWCPSRTRLTTRRSSDSPTLIMGQSFKSNRSLGGQRETQNIVAIIRHTPPAKLLHTNGRATFVAQLAAIVHLPQARRLSSPAVCIARDEDA
jgi:hypothetical protein